MFAGEQHHGAAARAFLGHAAFSQTLAGQPLAIWLTEGVAQEDEIENSFQQEFPMIPASHDLDELDLIQPPHIESHLCPNEVAAKQFLSRFVARVLVRTQRRKYQLLNQSADQWPHTLPGDAPPEALVAAKLLRHIHELRDALDRHDAVGCAWHALNVGQLGERFRAALATEEARPTWSSRSA
jgi:hypothetical protein